MLLDILVNQIALLFIYAVHSYDGCEPDIQAWLPYLKPNGTMVVHDFQGVSWVGVQQTV